MIIRERLGPVLSVMFLMVCLLVTALGACGSSPTKKAPRGEPVLPTTSTTSTTVAPQVNTQYYSDAAAGGHIQDQTWFWQGTINDRTCVMTKFGLSCDWSNG